MIQATGRLGRFLAVSRHYLLEGAMPSRRVPRRALVDHASRGEAVFIATIPVVAGPRRSVRPALATLRADQPSNENRPSATSLASG